MLRNLLQKYMCPALMSAGFLTAQIAAADTIVSAQVLTGTNNWFRTNIYMMNGGVFVMSNAEAAFVGFVFAKYS